MKISQRQDKYSINKEEFNNILDYQNNIKIRPINVNINTTNINFPLNLMKKQNIENIIDNKNFIQYNKSIKVNYLLNLRKITLMKIKIK
jgi:hypothetical protein